MNGTASAPVFIAVAPNGARHNKDDHPGVPISPRELADTAVSCADAGAAMIHLHVRDKNGKHSLEPEHYRPAIREIREAVGDAMLIQVTSEAAGVYAPEEQIRLIGELAPGGVSVSIREIFADHADTAARFLESLRQQGALVQYILYDREDVRWYRRLVAAGAIPDCRHLVLFVLGRYSHADTTPENLQDCVVELGSATPWMACAFGPHSFDVLTEAISCGGHIRIGFENGWSLPDGSVAADNATLVRMMAARIRDSGHRVASVPEASALLLNVNTGRSTILTSD